MKPMIMDLKKELTDCEQRVKTTNRQHYSVLVLTEMEESERMGRVCRALRYQPKLLHRSNNAEKGSDGQRACRTCGEGRACRTCGEGRACRTCGEGRACRTDRKLHVNQHNICRKGYRLMSGLDESKKKPDYEGEEQTEFPQSKKHACYLCGMEYVRKPSLVSHMRIHTGETPYKCKVCGKSFRRSDGLAEHMATHQDKRMSKKKRYACAHCEKVFRSKLDLKCHLRTHTGERPYSCAICQRRFYTESCHKRHLKCHSDDRPYTCSECGHGFKRPAHLNKHKRIHTGEKPFSCSLCGKPFAHKRSLSLHMNSSPCQRSQNGTS